ncbi:hypothetical protein EMEDMD4_440030 [Sinorhizobium medicae]|uniref:Uncharacterized protein n=1 Tax=Sinorhizobium medicae TaxID=110321 RepID=A0A508WZC3_9HYPH|nr:hypothetical protein EMEDMD4_440030 [Sinorhizobium medicae]
MWNVIGAAAEMIDLACCSYKSAAVHPAIALTFAKSDLKHV